MTHSERLLFCSGGNLKRHAKFGVDSNDLLHWLPAELVSLGYLRILAKKCLWRHQTTSQIFEHLTGRKVFFCDQAWSNHVWSRSKKWFQIYSFKKIFHYSTRPLTIFGKKLFPTFAFAKKTDIDKVHHWKAHGILYKNDYIVNLTEFFLATIKILQDHVVFYL